MGRRSLMSPVFFVAVIIGLGTPITAYHTTEDYPRQFSAGYSEVSIENGYYGRLYVSHYEHGYTRSEVCYYEFNRYEGETICQYYGYSYDTFISVSPRNSHNTVNAHCSSYRYGSYNFCDIRRLGNCAHVVYLQCHHDASSTVPYGWWTRETTETTEGTTQQQFTVGYSDVTLMYGTYGRVYIRHYQYGLDRYEVCSDGFSNTDGETLCRSKGYSYSSFSTTTPRNHYHTVATNCYLSDISNCIIQTQSYCSRAVYLYCSGTTTISTTTKWLTTHAPTSQSMFTVGISDVTIEHGTYGRVYIAHFQNGYKNYEVCSNGFSSTDGVAICHTWGLAYSSYSTHSPMNHYTTVNTNCYSYDIHSCAIRTQSYCSGVVYIYCHVSSTTLPWWARASTADAYETSSYVNTPTNTTSDEYETTSKSYGTCYSGVCYNGGTCIAYNNGYPGYYCNCPSGFTGLHCQNYATTYDACYPNPCQNGATCSRDYYYSRNYYCSCPRGYSGQNCEYYVGYYETTSYDPCYSHNPCNNGGTCYHNYGYPGYYCTCPSGYSGRNCDSYNGLSIESAITVACNENNWNAAVYLPPLYSRYLDFNPGDLYLGQDSCTGYVDGNYLRFRSDYTTCNTETKTSKDNIVHSNEIIYAVHDPNHHFIVREYRFRVPVDCFLPRNEESSNHYYHGLATIPPANHVTGSTHHTVHLRFYTDSSFQHPKSLYGSKVGDTVYVKAFTDVRDYSQKMRLSDCYATPTASPYSNLKYFIIQNGCVIDPNARILSQNTHETRFYFQDFEYSTDQNSLYLHCNATFCKSNDYSAACEQTCHHKRLGGGNVVFDGPVESFDVNDAVRLTSGGPSGNGNKLTSGNSTLLLVISLVFGGVILAMIIAIIVGKLKKRVRQRGTEVVKDI